MKRYLKTFSASLIAAVILVALLGYLLLFERDRSEKIETPQLLFPEVQKPQINSITLKYPDHEITLKMDGDKWFLIKDSGRVAADADSVRDLLDEVTEIDIEKTAAESPSNLDDFGLNSPRVEVILKTASDEYGLSAGADTPVGLGTYVTLRGDKKVLIVNRESLSPFLEKSEDDFRDKQILSLKGGMINRVIFRPPESSFEVEKKDGRWVAKDMPSYVQLDQNRMEVILKTFLNLKIDNFEVDEPIDLSAYGLVKPNAEIEIFERSKSVRVLFGNKKENGDYYVKLDSGDPVYSVSEYVFVQIPESIGDIRVRKVIDIDPAEVIGLDIRERDKVLSIRKDGDNWRVINDGAVRVNETKIKDLLDVITAMEVETFVEDEPKDLSRYGLDTPQVQVSVTGGNGGKITLLFGRREGKEVYAKVLGQDSIYKLSDALLSKIHVSDNEFGK